MKRRTVYLLGAFLILAVFFFCGALYWLLGTSDGARWLIAEISSHTSVSIEANKVEGRIWSDLRVEGIGVRWNGGRLTAEKFHVRWSPMRLLYGTVTVREVAFREVHVFDERPESKGIADIAWPHVNGLITHLNVNIRSFSVQGLVYRRLHGNPVSIRNISGGIIWRGGVLTVLALKAGSQSGRVEGTLRAGLVKPSLSLALALMPTKPLGGMDMISAGAELQARRVYGPLKGTIRLKGSSGTAPRFKLTGGLELEKHAVRLRDFRLTGPVANGHVTGSGDVSFTGKTPEFRLVVKASGLNLLTLLHFRTDLSAAIVLEGRGLHYRGKLDLSNRDGGIRSIRMHGDIHGDRQGLELTSVEGSWLGGTVRGTAHAGWKKEMSLQASVQVRDIDPSLISPDWTGRINADAGGAVVLAENRPLSVSFRTKLIRSSLRGKILRGDAKGRLVGRNLMIDHLLLEGKGFNVTASGALQSRITFGADISDLSGIIPGTRGALKAAGWFGRHDRHLVGSIRGRGERIMAGGLKIGSTEFSAGLVGSKGYPIHLKTVLRDLVFDRVRIGSAVAGVEGALTDHSIRLEVKSRGAVIGAKLSGSYGGGKWRGRIEDISGKDSGGAWRLVSPSALFISARKFSLSTLLMEGPEGESFKAEGEIAFDPLNGTLNAAWRRVRLDHANYWLTGIRIEGESSGTVYVRWLRNVLHEASASLDASGTLTLDGRKIEVSHASARIDRGKKRLVALFDIGMDKGATVKGHFSSVVRGGTFVPEEGRIDAELHGLDLSFFRGWFPAGQDIAGKVSGSLNGRLLEGRRLDISGSASIAGGIIRKKGEKGEITLSLSKAGMSFVWRKETLKGTVSMVLKDHGHVEGSFEIPVHAGIPPSIEGNGPVKVSLKGRFQEKGLLTALFPGLVQETRGRIDLGIKVGGVWKTPDLRGKMQISEAGAYFPSGGIHIKDAGMSAHLEGDRVIIDSFHAQSGPGKVEGAAEIELRNWGVVSYKGTIKGKDFQAIYLPEFRLQASPDLVFDGSKEKLSLKGEIRIPYLLVLQSKTKAPVESSRDVIIVDREAGAEKKPEAALDIRVRVILGKSVLVKAEGIDARLGGSVDVTAKGLNDIRGKGEIHVEKGKYSAYGVNLNVERGRAVFAGQAINKPDLDILALRKAGSVRAGVTVTGTPQNPVVKLYSEPPMADTDILAYMVLGHALGSSQQQASLVTQAAGFLLSASQSVVFQNQLKRRLGIDTLDIESAPATTTSAPGVPVTGESTSSTSGGVARSLVTVGKYLTPKLYISYGRSLLGDTNLFRVRYDFSKHWQVETQSGTESGADLFYKIDLK